MKINCENIVVCGNYNCYWNVTGRCGHDIVSIGADGKCAMEKSKTIPNNGGKPAQNKPNTPYNFETSK